MNNYHYWFNKVTEFVGDNKLPVDRGEESAVDTLLTTGSSSTITKSLNTSTVSQPEETTESLSTVGDKVNFAIDERKGDKKEKGKTDTKEESASQPSEKSGEKRPSEKSGEKKQSEREEEEKNEVVTAWTEWSDCDRPDGRQVRRRACKASTRICRGKLLESRPCTTSTVTEYATVLKIKHFILFKRPSHLKMKQRHHRRKR